ncbi:transcription elongation factor GreA [candidate division WWE3 bacterium RIFCSPLOWO2_01_FULL_53_14]|uniref:Transcription elongation factor GreA n=1 Tax=candidate division WWE3 bacterium RIFCSPLOWO2_01_FULL_53_14 TaxID=1802628 RepID=A0A1F4VZ69_UNCKA|nr:MAG: transcription elongation factor GreA [candidate division WWE3 bacterium RIFCSPLOWO2_01_FULL_53_14]
MVEEKVYLTREGLKNLQEEYDQLVNVRRKEVAEKLQKARDLGDITENAAYDTARDEQAFVEGRVAELDDLLKRVEMVGEEKASAVQVGSKVKVHLDGNEQEFQIVGAPEANPVDGKISHESPLGQALLGKKVGEEVEIDAPAGRLIYHVLEIK